MTKKLQSITTERKLTKLTTEAYENLPELCSLMALEKDLDNMTFTAAASAAINEATRRYRRRAVLREQRAQVAA